MANTIPVTYRHSHKVNKDGQCEYHIKKRFVEDPEELKRKAHFADINAKAVTAFRGVAA